MRGKTRLFYCESILKTCYVLWWHDHWLALKNSFTLNIIFTGVKIMDFMNYINLTIAQILEVIKSQNTCMLATINTPLTNGMATNMCNGIGIGTCNSMCPGVCNEMQDGMWNGAGAGTCNAVWNGAGSGTCNGMYNNAGAGTCNGVWTGSCAGTGTCTNTNTCTAMWAAAQPSPEIVPMYYAYQICGNNVSIIFLSQDLGEKINNMATNPNVSIEIDRVVNVPFGNGCGNQLQTVVLDGTAYILQDPNLMNTMMNMIPGMANMKMANGCGCGMQNFTIVRVDINQMTGRGYNQACN